MSHSERESLEGYQNKTIIILFHWNLLILRLQKSVDKNLKNHYIVSDKTSRNNGKNTYKK